MEIGGAISILNSLSCVGPRFFWNPCGAINMDAARVFGGFSLKESWGTHSDTVMYNIKDWSCDVAKKIRCFLDYS